MAALVGVLTALPSAAGALPVGSSDAGAQDLLDRVRASDRVGWSGLAESRAALALPDVQDLGELPGLLGGTTRTRAWWRDRADWRVDQLTLVGEVDVVQAPGRTTTWVSADRRASILFGELPVRLPRAADLLAPVLGRRLAATPDTRLSRLPERRVAGRTAAGLRVAPQDPATTTVESVDLWVEPATGLPLRVEVRAQGARLPVLTSVVLDLELAVPSVQRTAFDLPDDGTAALDSAPDVAALIDRFAPYVLPPVLAGAGRTDPAGLDTGGAGTYGTGLQAYAVVPLPGDAGRRVRRAAPDGVISTPLVNAAVGGNGRRTYLLVGTVPPGVLQGALAALVADPPPRRDRS